MSAHHPADYHQITNNIWIGTNMCCMAHNKVLQRLGFQADIDLENERAEEPPHTPVYLWLPTPDHTPPSQQQMSVGVACLAEITQQRLKAYVHCKNGHGRAPTLVAAFFIAQGMSVREAIAALKSKRPSMHLNAKQIAALTAFAGLFPV